MTIARELLGTLTAGILSVFFCYYFPSSQGYWAIVTALFLIQLRFNDTTWKNVYCIIGSAMLIACHLVFIHFFATHFIFLALYLFITTFISIYIGLRASRYALPSLFFNLMGIISIGLTTDTEIFLRLKYIGVGTCIALILNLILWTPPAKQFKQLLINGLLAINQLQIILFSIYQQRDYINQHYFYELKLHQARTKIFNILQQLQKQSNRLVNQQYTDIQDHLILLFDSIISLGSLRYRISDHAVLEVAEKDFLDISHHISFLIKQISSQNLSELNTSHARDLVQSLENVSRATLEVMTEDAIVYLIFIQNVRAVFETLDSLVNAINIGSQSP